MGRSGEGGRGKSRVKGERMGCAGGCLLVFARGRYACCGYGSLFSTYGLLSFWTVFIVLRNKGRWRGLVEG